MSWWNIFKKFLYSVFINYRFSRTFFRKQFFNILLLSDQSGLYAYLLVCVLVSGIFLEKIEKIELKETMDALFTLFVPK